MLVYALGEILSKYCYTKAKNGFVHFLPIYMATTLGFLSGKSEKEKKERLKEASQHLQNVDLQRRHYNTVIWNCMIHPPAVLQYKTISKPMYAIQPCSFKGTMHYSFDFAQQISIPYSSQQVGATYFLAGYKIGLFGIVNEALRKFYLYVIPESCNPGVGANLVVSFVA